IARRLTDAGVRVGVSARSTSEIEAVAREIGGVALRADAGDRSSVDALLSELGARLGAVGILVNNAGIASSAALARVEDAAWDEMMEVNVTSAFRITRALAPRMIERGWGRIVNVASNAGVSGCRYTVAYCASKHAMVGMTRALAVDFGPTGVTINA